MAMEEERDRYFVGLTGASGHVYAETLVRALVAIGYGVDLSVTDAGAKVLGHELGVRPGKDGSMLAARLEDWLGPDTAAHVRAFRADAIEAPPSSGTARIRGVCLVPCSVGTLARVAHGFSSNLVERAADVALKEGRSLCLVVRETPLSSLHLENMLNLSKRGAVILPAMPGFYHGPTTIQDLVDQLVGKILDRLGLDHTVGARWRGLGRSSAHDPGPRRGSET